jgi:hypothetical protein
MKNKNWIAVLLIIVCVAGYYGYRALDLARTDTKAPKIEINTERVEVSVLDPKSALLQGVTAMDNVDGDVTESVVVESISLLNRDGTISVSYAAFDSTGNVAKATREAKYTDYESPKLTLSGPLLYGYGSNFDVLSTVGATDMIDGDIQHRVRATALEEDSIATLGTHQVRFQVNNSLGDTMALELPVEVYAADTYNAGLTLTEYLIYLPVGANFNPSSYLGDFTLRGETTNLRNGLPGNYTLRTKGEVQTQQPGVYCMEYRVTYTVRNETNPNLNQEYTGYSKLIVVVEG